MLHKLNQIFFWYRHEYLLVCMFWNNFFLYLIMMSTSKIFFFPAQARAHFKQGQSPIWKKRIFCMHGVHRISDSFRILLTNKTFKFINAYQGWQQNQPDPAALHFTVAVCVWSTGWYIIIPWVLVNHDYDWVKILGNLIQGVWYGITN